MNFLPLMVVTALLHAYIAARLLPGLTAFVPGQWLLPGALALSALLIPLGLLGLRRDPAARARRLMHGLRWAPAAGAPAAQCRRGSRIRL